MAYLPSNRYNREIDPDRRPHDFSVGDRGGNLHRHESCVIAGSGLERDSVLIRQSPGKVGEVWLEGRAHRVERPASLVGESAKIVIGEPGLSSDSYRRSADTDRYSVDDDRGTQGVVDDDIQRTIRNIGFG